MSSINKNNYFNNLSVDRLNVKNLKIIEDLKINNDNGNFIFTNCCSELTNKTINSEVNNISNLEFNNFKNNSPNTLFYWNSIGEPSHINPPKEENSILLFKDGIIEWVSIDTLNLNINPNFDTNTVSTAETGAIYENNSDLDPEPEPEPEFESESELDISSESESDFFIEPEPEKQNELVYNPKNAFIDYNFNNLLGPKKDDNTIISKCYLYTNKEDKSLLVHVNGIPDYIPKFRNNEIKGKWDDTNELSMVGKPNSYTIAVSNKGWVIDNKQHGDPLKIPLFPKVCNFKNIENLSKYERYWNNENDDWYEYCNNPYDLPLGPIGISKNGILFYSHFFDTNFKDGVYGQYSEVNDMQGGHPNPENVYHYKKFPITSFSFRTEVEYELDESNVVPILNEHLTKKGMLYHSPLIGYAFDGYPIYGPIGFNPNDNSDLNNRSLKLIQSKYDGSLDKYENPQYNSESTGDLDICNGIFSPTPEYPLGVYHYHTTLKGFINKNNNWEVYTQISSNNLVSSSKVQILDGVLNKICVPQYPYIIGKFHGIPESNNFLSLKLNTNNDDLNFFSAFKKDIEDIIFNNPSNIKYKNNKYYILEQTGKIHIIDTITGILYKNFIDLNIDLEFTNDDIGLFDMCFHPNFENNKKFYLYFSDKSPKINMNHRNYIREYVLNEDNIVDYFFAKTIYYVDFPQANNNGGSIVFGPLEDDKHYMYVSIGDGGGKYDNEYLHTGYEANEDNIIKTGNLGNAQDTSNVHGSILRIDVDYEFLSGPENIDINIINNKIQINDQEAETIYLERGKTYRFNTKNINIFLDDPFYIKTEIGIFNSEYISNNDGNNNNSIILDIPLNCPDKLKYSTNNYQGEIMVIDPIKQLINNKLINCRTIYFSDDGNNIKVITTKNIIFSEEQNVSEIQKTLDYVSSINPTIYLVMGENYIFDTNNLTENLIFGLDKEFTNLINLEVHEFNSKKMIKINENTPKIFYYKTSDLFGIIKIKFPIIIPSDGHNIFNSPYHENEDKPEIYAYGFRNPRDICFKLGAYHNSLFVIDQSENEYEEINLINSLDYEKEYVYPNYGWRKKVGNLKLDEMLKHDINDNFIKDPIYAYKHKKNNNIVGGIYYEKENSLLDDKFIFAEKSGNMFYLKEEKIGVNSDSSSKIWKKGIIELNNVNDYNIHKILKYTINNKQEIFIILRNKLNNIGKIYKLTSTSQELQISSIVKLL